MKRIYCTISRLAAMAAAIAVALSVCGCSTIDLSVDDLMHAPQPTKQQEEIRNTLKASLGTDEFTFYTPRSGTNRTAVLYGNLYGTGDLEAVVLYYLSNNIKETRINVLTRGEEQAWQSICDFAPSEGNQVDRLYICDMMSNGYSQLIIGTTMYLGKNNELSVWEFDGDTPKKTYQTIYAEIVTGEFTNDGSDKIITLSFMANDRTKMEMHEYTGAGGISVTSETELAMPYTSWTNVIGDTLDTGSNAVFIDGVLSSGEYATEVVSIISGTLNNVFGADCPTRTVPINCMDINADGRIEVPVQGIMPGYANVVEAEQMKKITWSSCGTVGLTSMCTSVVNRKWEYIFIIPESLSNSVTVLSEQDSSGTYGTIWTFFTWDAQKQATRQKLFTLRCMTVRDWQENEILHTNQQELKTSGNICCTVQFYGTPVVPTEALQDALFFY